MVVKTAVKTRKVDDKTPGVFRLEVDIVEPDIVHDSPLQVPSLEVAIDVCGGDCPKSLLQPKMLHVIPAHMAHLLEDLILWHGTETLALRSPPVGLAQLT